MKTFTDLEAFISYARQNLSYDDPQILRKLQNLLGQNVKVRYEREGDYIKRFLLTSMRHRVNLSIKFYRQLNGVIFDRQWNILSMPPPMLKNDNIPSVEQYEIYPVQDGTIVTLYYDASTVEAVGTSITDSDNVTAFVVAEASAASTSEKLTSDMYGNVVAEASAASTDVPPGLTIDESLQEQQARRGWKLSSSNGFSVGNYNWLSNISYEEALFELLERYPAFSFQKLRKDWSYTLGFRHHQFHPYERDPERVWFVQACDLKQTNNVVFVNCNAAEFMSGKKFSPLPVIRINYTLDIGLPIQQPITIDAKTMRELNESSVTRIVNNSTPHYGFFLREKNGDGDIICDSELLKLLRGLFYNFPKKANITSENRMWFAITRAYLSVKHKYPFITIFPQFEEYYKQLDVIFNQLVNHCHSLAVGKRTPDSPEHIANLAKYFAGKLQQSSVSVNNAHGWGIVQDVIIDSKNHEMLFENIPSLV